VFSLDVCGIITRQHFCIFIHFESLDNNYLMSSSLENLNIILIKPYFALYT